jgi:hypothetical protein
MRTRTLLRPSGVIGAIAILAALAGISGAGAQPPAIPDINMPLVEWVASRPHAQPETLPSFETDAARMAQFGTMLEALIDRDWAKAAATAKSLSYVLGRIREAGDTFVVAADDSGTGRDPTIIIHGGPRRDFLVEAPHVPFERGTAEQAAVLLLTLKGRAAIISGAHRCASRSFTACDGMTEVCGTSQRFRDSDAGHNVAGLFHAAHVVFAERWPRSIAISLHGMREDTEGVRTSLVISNGIDADDTRRRTAATRLRRALGRSITRPGAVVSCNVAGDDAHDFPKLCGLTNVQGRQINGDADACRINVGRGTGRFIHLEQDGSVREPYTQGWAQIDGSEVHRALVRAFRRVLPRVRSR